jgi:hypothetical protein
MGAFSGMIPMLWYRFAKRPGPRDRTCDVSYQSPPSLEDSDNMNDELPCVRSAGDICRESVASEEQTLWRLERIPIHEGITSTFPDECADSG